MKIVLFVLCTSYFQSTKYKVPKVQWALPRATEMKFQLLQFCFVRRFGVHKHQALRLRTTVYSKQKATLLRDKLK
jgi:hypothetical protein